MYDAPYRLEQDGADQDGKIRWVIQKTGEGVICKGLNFNDMRNLVDRANEAALHVEDRHR